MFEGNAQIKNLLPDALLSSHEVGSLLQMDASSVVKWVNSGLLPAYRTPGGHRRVRVSELIQFLRAKGMFVPAELVGHSLKTLVVDDDAQLLASLTRAARNHSEAITLQTRQSGIEALVAIGSWRPDVVVLDVQMPEMDGIEVCRRLKQQTETRNIEVLMMTGAYSKDVEKACLEAGAKAVLVKPVTMSRLIETMTTKVPYRRKR